MTLETYLEQYNLQNDIRRSTLEHYWWVVQSLNSFAGCRAVHLSELSSDLMNRYLLYLRETGKSPFTIKNRRNSILVLWRAAWRDGLAPPVEEVRRVRTPDPPKDVWSTDDVVRLIHTCRILTGCFRLTDIRRTPYFQTMIRAAYDTGLRRSDLQRIKVADIDRMSQQVGVLQVKTSRVVVVRMHPETVEAIREFVSGTNREYVWPAWSRRREAFSRLFKKIVHAAGLVGTFCTLRKTSGTEVERARVGYGWLHLGHSTPETARQWYINPERAYSVDRPLPPPLELADQ